MEFFTKDQLNELQKVRLFPCITFYLPVQKEGADTRQGPIRLRKMVKATEEALHDKGLRTPQIEQIIKPVQALYDNALFWEHQDACLALFINENGMLVHQLPITADESVTISNRFMTRPLLSMFGQDGHYYLLSLGLSDIKLHRCTRFSRVDIPMSGLPESLKAIFDTYSVEKQLQHHSGTGKVRYTTRGVGGSVFHGSESMKDSEKDRIDEYFRQIDISLKKALGDDRAPVVTVCVDYLYPLFKAVSRDPRLMEDHISGSPDTLKRDVLLKSGWDIVRPHFEQEKAAAINSCLNLMGTPRVIEDIRLILPAAMHRQIDTLFVLKGSHAWGRIDPQSGQVVLFEDQQPGFGEEELMDQALMHVLRHGGRAFALEKPEMPEETDCLAILRYETK